MARSRLQGGTSDFAGSVRCEAVGEGLFTAVALEMDTISRIFTTLPVVPLRKLGVRSLREDLSAHS